MKKFFPDRGLNLRGENAIFGQVEAGRLEFLKYKLTKTFSVLFGIRYGFTEQNGMLSRVASQVSVECIVEYSFEHVPVVNQTVRFKKRLNVHVWTWGFVAHRVDEVLFVHSIRSRIVRFDIAIFIDYTRRVHRLGFVHVFFDYAHIRRKVSL